MRSKPHVRLALMAVVLVGTLSFVSCESCEHRVPPQQTSEAVYVIFEGPWAIVSDPNNPNSVIAIAPKTPHHHPLAVVPGSQDRKGGIKAGIYDLEVPAHGTVGERNLTKGFLRASIDPKNVERALGNKMQRYAIRLPKPEAYVAETRYESRVSDSYPPKEDTQQDFVSAISLVYHVTTKTGFQLTGTQDEGGTFHPILPQLDTPTLRFVLDPADFLDDICDIHPRQAFHDLTQLIGVKLYVDFYESANKECYEKDPQNPEYRKAAAIQVLPGLRTVGLDGPHFLRPEEAAFVDDAFARYVSLAATEAWRRWGAVLYFFHSNICKAPTILGQGI